jgi:hypothetical protein
LKNPILVIGPFRFLKQEVLCTRNARLINNWYFKRGDPMNLCLDKKEELEAKLILKDLQWHYYK